ncbi:MAG: lysostaphin resistance A-like protein, partial [Promethearchaeota archaeon]
INTNAMMKGKAFLWLQTLPISKEKLQKLGIFSIFRFLDVPLVISIMGFPVIMLIITQNVLLFIACLFSSFAFVSFGFFFFIIISIFINRVFGRSKTKTKKENLVRIITMIGYLIIVFSASIILQISINSITELIAFFATNSPSPLLIVLFCIIPIPFSSGFLIAMFTVPIETVPIGYIVSILVGFCLFCVITIILYRYSKKTLGNLSSTGNLQGKALKLPVEQIEEVQVTIKTTTPLKTFLKKDLTSITHDVQSFMYAIMPVIMPLIMGLSFQRVLVDEVPFLLSLMIVWTIILSMSFLMPFMIVVGFLNIEESNASIIASLPILYREKAKAKLILMLTIQGISMAVSILILTITTGSITALLLFLTTLPISWVFLFSLFEMKICLFGKLKHKYVTEEVNKGRKTEKWIAMIVFQFTLFTIFTVAGFVMFNYFTIEITIATLFSIGTVGLIITVFIFTRMFPKLEKTSDYVTGGYLRDHPVVCGFLLTLLYLFFRFYLTYFVEILFAPLVEIIPFTVALFIDFSLQFGFLCVLLLVIVPRGFKIPNNNQKLGEFASDIRLDSVGPIGRNILLGLASFFVFSLITFTGANLLAYYYDIIPEIVFGPINPPPYYTGWFYFIGALTPAIWEEVLFRGIIMTMLLKKGGQINAIVLSSLMFGLMHGPWILGFHPYPLINVAIITYAFLMGIAFGYMYVKTQSLLAPIILHYLVDSIGFLFMPILISFENLTVFYFLFVGVFPAFYIILITYIIAESRNNSNNK